MFEIILIGAFMLIPSISIILDFVLGDKLTINKNKVDIIKSNKIYKIFFIIIC